MVLIDTCTCVFFHLCKLVIDLPVIYFTTTPSETVFAMESSTTNPRLSAVESSDSGHAAGAGAGAAAAAPDSASAIADIVPLVFPYLSFGCRVALAQTCPTLRTVAVNAAVWRTVDCSTLIVLPHPDAVSPL